MRRTLVPGRKKSGIWLALTLVASAAMVAPARADSSAATRLLVSFADSHAAERALARFGGTRVGATGWAGVANPSTVRGLAGVRYVGNDAKVYAADTVPNDPCVGTCNVSNTQWYLPVVKAPSAWDRAKGGGVTVAILDSGVDATHPDLAPKMVGAQVNFAEDQTNGEHGTKVAGVAGAATDNGIGVASVGWNVGCCRSRCSTRPARASPVR